MKQLCSSGKVNGWSRWWKRTVDLPSDWRAMAREGTRIRERANMTGTDPPINLRRDGKEIAMARGGGGTEVVDRRKACWKRGFEGQDSLWGTGLRLL